MEHTERPPSSHRPKRFHALLCFGLVTTRTSTSVKPQPDLAQDVNTVQDLSGRGLEEDSQIGKVSD